MSKNTFYRHQMALLPAVMAMSARGVRVDDELRQKRLCTLSTEAERLRESVLPVVESVQDRLLERELMWETRVCKRCHNGKKKKIGCMDCLGEGKHTEFVFNLASPRQLGDVLYNGLKLPRRSKHGKVTVDEEALKSLLALDKSGFVEKALRFNKLDTMQEIYERISPHAAHCASGGGHGPMSRPFGECACTHDFHVRTVYNPAGTYTGRFSSAEAFYVPASTNLQNLPAEEAKRDPLFAVRDCIVPDAGEVFVYCVGGHTRVLKSDLTWEIAERIQAGDELIGFDENGRTRKFRRALVTNNDPVMRHCVRVVTDKGTVTCSTDHLWLSKRGRQARTWIRAGALRKGDQLPWLGFPWDIECSYDAGWLAGLFDGEGHLCDTAVGFTQKEGKGVWERAIPLLQDRGFPLSIDRNSGGIPRANLRGIYANLRFLGQIRPKRLLQKSTDIWEGRKIWGSRSHPATVLAVDVAGQQNVYPVTTTTKTFVAEGILTHNCDLSQAELRVSAVLSEDWERVAQLADPKFDAHKFTAAAIFNKPESAVTDRERQLGKTCNHALNYGMGPNKFWRTVNDKADMTGIAITMKEAKAYWKAYHALYPKLDGVWWSRVQATLEARKPMIASHCGWECPFWPRFDDAGQLDHESLRAGIAWEPQHTVAHILNEGLLELYDAEDGSYRVLLQAHDAVLLGVQCDSVQHVAKMAKRVLERPQEIAGRSLTIPAEVFVGEESWSKLKRIL